MSVVFIYMAFFTYLFMYIFFSLHCVQSLRTRGVTCDCDGWNRRVCMCDLIYKRVLSLPVFGEDKGALIHIKCPHIYIFRM